MHIRCGLREPLVQQAPLRHVNQRTETLNHNHTELAAGSFQAKTSQSSHLFAACRVRRCGLQEQFTLHDSTFYAFRCLFRPQMTISKSQNKMKNLHPRNEKERKNKKIPTFRTSWGQAMRWFIARQVYSKENQNIESR